MVLKSFKVDIDDRDREQETLVIDLKSIIIDFIPNAFSLKLIFHY